MVSARFSFLHCSGRDRRSLRVHGRGQRRVLRSKTVFIVGAGASVDYGLPTGKALKSDIARLLYLNFDATIRTKEDPKIVEALTIYAHQTGALRPEPFLAAAAQICQALPLDQSIDSVLEAHRDNRKLLLCGKLAIVAAILLAERKSSLYLGDRSPEGILIDFSTLEDTWKVPLFQLIREGRTIADVRSFFNNVGFVNFNYDRCIEHFLLYALRSMFGMREVDAADIMDSLRIVHPYGSLGPLPWQSRDPTDRVAFGGFLGGDRLLKTSQNILTYGERVEDPTRLAEIGAVLKGADRVVFLGFGFHRQNMDLLFAAGGFGPAQILATGWGISYQDASAIKNETLERMNDKILDLVRGGENRKKFIHHDKESLANSLGWVQSTPSSFEIEQNMKCDDLLRSYWQTLSS